MDGANADSDHSMTWEDFFGSTTDLTPTLIGIYDSLIEPTKSPNVSKFDLTAKDARNNPPLKTETMIEDMKTPIDVPTKLSGVKLPVNKSSLYSLRTKVESEVKDSVTSDLTSSDSTVVNKSNLRTMKTEQKVSEVSAFDTLSPNVKRMVSSATEATGNALKFQKRTTNAGRSSGRGHRSNIPLVGATSKITQSRIELPSSAEIYDQPTKAFNKSKSEEPHTEESPSKVQTIKPEFKLNVQETYDVPTNNRSVIYDVPSKNSKTAFESLSLPYIDQSIELSISANDREFDIKLNSKDNTPDQQDKPKSPQQSPLKLPRPVNGGTNSLNRKDFNPKTDSPIKQLAKTAPYPEAIGSTGNLKAAPEKEVPRLNPPTVEVSRPLSMSSIASSSSTSSSGVQNKGGVNSAYLASIESLDDHSDADVTSGNGSNIFVNNAGMMNKSASEERHSDTLSREPDEMSGLTQLELVCAEIVHTENVYVQDLQQVVEGYLHEWKREMAFSEEELSEVFNNIEDIYTFNRSLCEELNTCRLDATCIARCFANNTSGFSVYTSYCTGYPRTMARLAALASDPRSAREFRERQIALGHPLPLASYLLKPVQRLLKYHLLLQNVVKQCASRETEYALLKMTGIAQHIDDMKRRHEHAVRVQEIQSLLYGWNGPDLTTYGELCAEGTFRVFGAKAMRHAFLFDKMLLITKNREDGILAYKMHIMCNNMMLVESIAGAPLSFHVIPWDAPRSQLTLQARSPRHKREWTLLLKRVILENYNAVIPSHARQILMELGQNKTDDDMLAEKSHNLITQASMRKQLSAPEYLEKRKLERERRKSFENGIRGRLKKANRKYTVPVMKTTLQDCDCAQVSLEKGIDYTCDSCYIDLCSDCENELSSKDKKTDCLCRDANDGEKCAECDRALHFVDAGSHEHIERKNSVCKCADYKSSQEIFSKDSLNKTRGYHSSDNIVGYADDGKSKEDLTETINSMTNVRNITKTCLKCSKIKENIVTDSSSTLHHRRSRCNDLEKPRTDTLRSKSKEDSQRSKLSKIGTWRRKSEPGLQQNPGLVPKRSQDSDSDRPDMKGTEKIEFECRNCGSNKISKKGKANPSAMISDPEMENGKRGISAGLKSNLDIKVYTTKNIPKKISKLKKSRAKGVRLGSDTTAKFYADLSTDVSTENILHITESTDSLVDKAKSIDNAKATLKVPETISKDDDIDEETYKKLIEKTDSFKKNELEKVKYLNKQNVINEGSEIEGDKVDIEVRRTEDPTGSCEETEQPLEQIISQLLMQNREFQKLLKKQQLRNSAQRRHQRLLKSHSNPEQAITTRSGDWKFKPKYIRQMSENLDLAKINVEEKAPLSPPQEVNDASDDDHIYETLRVDNRVDETLHSLNNKSKSIQQNPRVSRPKRLPSPPNPHLKLPEMAPKIGTHDSDYVYLSFDKLNKLQDNTDGIYDVPVRSPQKVQDTTADYYVTMEKSGPLNSKENIEDLYDNIIEVCRRKKDAPSTVTSEYLPMGPEPQSPNTPEIWLSRQKEHFNVSRDRKSGSLPRSFQVPVNNPDEANLSSFKSKPNSNSKTYLNRDGKVMSNDRPYTIASDQSEISYDDVENYMSEGDILKFNKNTGKPNDVELQNISQSTLELEEEIDRCYKNNFEAKLDTNKNEFLLNVPQPNLDISTTSSCEVLPAEPIDAKKPSDTEVIHPEHRIYKPTGNILSLKNVLSRFKSKTPNKSTDDSEINANDPSSPDSTKSDPKSPTSEKRSALNPRSYSKNLLQRFRSIIGDEHPEDNHDRSESPQRHSKKVIEELQQTLKNDVKVIITATEASPTIASLVYSTNDALSKSTYETTTLTESQNEKNNLEALSQSCDDIVQKQDQNRPAYEKSISLVTNISNSVSNTTSPSKSNNSSYQSLNKLPIYMQGSKHLGARIAQSDYVDPTTLMSEKASLKNVNVLINRNSVRPDSLFSNSSFVTSSSEGNYQEGQTKVHNDNIKEVKEPNASVSSMPGNPDESYYEKTFEKIENVTDEDVFRDSAVYSDQEDGDDSKTESSTKHKHISRTTSRVESIKRESSFRTQKTTTTTSVTENKTSQTRVLVTTSKFQHLENVNLTKEKTIQTAEKTKPKVAPPVPIKPKITSIPTTSNFHTRNVVANRSFIRSEDKSPSNESVNVKTIKRNTNLRQSFVKSQPASFEDKTKAQIQTKEIKKETVRKIETVTDETDSKTNTMTESKLKPSNYQTESKTNAATESKHKISNIKTASVINPTTTTESLPKTSNIQMKRLSFERASLDSATRKSKPQIEPKRASVEPAKVTSKTVLERRMEIESITKTVHRPYQGVKKPSQIAKPKSMTTKVSPFERSVSEMGAREMKESKSVDTSHSNVTNNDEEDPNNEFEVERGSWVKTVVNKFQ